MGRLCCCINRKPSARQVVPRSLLAVMKNPPANFTMRPVHCITTIKTMAHTSWNCKYHIVFAPKFRRKVFYGERRLEIPPKYAVSSVVGFLKGKSSLQLYERFPELKFKYRNREFWCRGYYVDTAGKNAARIANYIKHQLDEDYLGNS